MGSTGTPKWFWIILEGCGIGNQPIGVGMFTEVVVFFVCELDTANKRKTLYLYTGFDKLVQNP